MPILTSEQVVEMFNLTGPSKRFCNHLAELAVFSYGGDSHRAHIRPITWSEGDEVQVNGFDKLFVYGHTTIEKKSDGSYSMWYSNSVVENKERAEHPCVWKCFSKMISYPTRDRSVKNLRSLRKEITNADVDMLIKGIRLAMNP
ncbi:hypothetical protein [Aneurinibacillus tyrosinisolvens]|uniref:hypothetical protein n=1 Tax=Aneurinibacillus tyrosinisolvens TaxID=1443435 RepID=UPI00063F23C4|nr:hypothetical protein [Aneurinibacillus tyrosinisolvens]